MTESKLKTVGEDGIFKLLTWRSLAITELFGLPRIVGEPIQQEFHFPAGRRVDRLYRLEDGSLLNIEHQSSLADRDALARRMITYHVMIKEEFPVDCLLQVVVYTGKAPVERSKIGAELTYASRDASNAYGIVFSAALRDFRSAPIDVFRKSGTLDDLILGLMAAGGDDEDYIAEVKARMQAVEGVRRREAVEKFLAVCVNMPDRKVAQLRSGEMETWIDDLKDSPIFEAVMRIAGRERLLAAEREGEARGEAIGEARGLAKAIVRHARKAGLRTPDDAENLLAAHADKTALLDMVEAMSAMTDFDAFVKSHGVELP